MQYRANKQQGMTMLSLIVVMMILGFLVMCALKVGPIYMTHGQVVQALESLKNRPEIETKSKREIFITLRKQLGINNINVIKKEHVTITKELDYLKVQIIYHVKEPFIKNLSIWVDFDNFVEVSHR
ncbi:MAG: DUF4845 domain-containing protein [Methyloprofundus sp.]|nr:DUF4845 domain-containing protein [Methyloprofundus sp.]